MEYKRNIQYCYHCMEQLNGGNIIYCPYCGKDIKKYTFNERVLPPGTILAGKYLVGEVIGEGGFGITYKGTDLNLFLKVAIKEYFPAMCASRSISTGADNKIHIISGEKGDLFRKGLEDYAKEANRLVQFASLPGIVSVLNFFYENNTAYMVMDFIDGITLKDYLSKHDEQLGWQETLGLLHPIIQSLKQVHQAGIIHRDISPDNIMISKSGEMILIDFGAARKVEGNQKKNTVILKKAYAPLEQYQTDGNQGTWSDVYSICSVIYRIISGEKVPDALSVASGDISIQPLKSLVSDVPEFLDNTVSKGLVTEISMRIQNMDELERYLYQNEKIKKKTDKKKMTALIALFAVIIAAGILWLFSSQQKENEIGNNNQVNSENLDIENRNENDVAEATNISALDAEYEAMEDTLELEYENIGEGLAITNVDYSVVEVVIPGNIEGVQVVELRGMSPNATSVVIKNGVEKITSGTFRNCVYLESIYIPASVTTIEENAFENCLVLSEIIVSKKNSNFYSENGKLYTTDGNVIFE